MITETGAIILELLNRTPGEECHDVVPPSRAARAAAAFGARRRRGGGAGACRGRPRAGRPAPPAVAAPAADAGRVVRLRAARRDRPDALQPLVPPERAPSRRLHPGAEAGPVGL